MKGKIIITMSLIFIIFLAFYSYIRQFAEGFVLSYGLLGLFILVIVLDTVIQPISPDLLVFAAAIGGLNFWIVGLLGGFGSCIAGIVGFIIANKHLSEVSNNKSIEKAKKLFRKYGIFAVVIGALSPIPYSSICWAAGASRMKFMPFISVSILTRIPRFLVMAYIGSLL